MVIKGYAADIFQIDMLWPIEANKRGLRDPFQVSQDLFHKRCSWEENERGFRVMTLREPTVEELADEPTDAEKEEYVRQRDEWIVEQCYKKISWECAIYAAELRHVENYLDNLRPCESADGQCRFDCKELGICEKADS